MSLFVLDTSGNKDLLKSDKLTAPKFEVSKQRKLLNETQSTSVCKFAAALKNEKDIEGEKEEYDFFGKFFNIK